MTSSLRVLLKQIQQTLLRATQSLTLVLQIWKKGVPAGTPLVAGHAGICNSIVRYYTQRNGICQSFQLDIWFNVMICTNQFPHTQIIIIANPQFLNFLISRNQVTTETKPGDTVALTAAKRSPRWRGLYLTPIRFPYPNGSNTWFTSSISIFFPVPLLRKIWIF